MNIHVARGTLALAALWCAAATARAGASGPHPAAWDALRTPASPSAHLYVASANGLAGSVLRFPLVDGRPASKPDFVYQGVTAPLAVADDGTLYASSNLCNTCYGEIDVWPPGAGSPSGHVTLPPAGLEGTQPRSLAASASGDFFVGYVGTISAAYLASVAAPAHEQEAPLHGIAVYRRDHLRGPPFETYDVPIDAVGPEALTLSPATPDDLYVTTTDDSDLAYIETVAHPQGNPQFVRQVQLGSYYTGYFGGSAFDGGARNFYELVYKGPQEEVVVLRRDASGPVHPLRNILLYGPPDTTFSSLALLGPNAFTVASHQGLGPYRVDVFPSGARGPVVLKSVLAFPKSANIQAVAVGP